MKKKKTTYKPFDAAAYLDNDAVIAEYLSVAAEGPNPEVFVAALGDVAKGLGMAQIAKDAGLGRESLYKTLSAGAHPRFETINSVLRALKVKFAVVSETVGTFGENVVFQSNAPTKKATINRHRAAFGLWRLVHETLEAVVIRDRGQQQSFERALDLLFIQAFKSHGSLYSLCVLGHCEDAATIARRILEIALQVGYLDSEEPDRENRGNQYLAYFWHLTKGILANPSLPHENRQRWQQLYDQNKKWLRLNKRGNPLPN